MLPVSEAVQHVLTQCAKAAPNIVTIPLMEALHCVLAEDVAAIDALPPFAASIMVCRRMVSAHLRGASFETTGRVVCLGRLCGDRSRWPGRVPCRS